METTTESTKSEHMVLVGVNPLGIPDLFRAFGHWVVWKLVPKKDRFTKVPYSAKTGTRASTTDSRTWATFPEALEALESGKYGGIGFVLSSGDPFVAFDFDDCRDPETGEVDEDVLQFIRRFKNRYVEVSPSGTGLHLITHGKLLGGTKKGGYELYGVERYMTFTGEVYDV